MQLREITATRKNGAEQITYNDLPQKNATLLDFWQWSSSDIMSNATRGIFAEFIVALALDLHRKLRKEWDTYDLMWDKEDIKIEVKSSAYIQSWYQKDFSQVKFSIKKSKAWDSSNNQLAEESKHHADVYVFCVLSHKDQNTINPLNLNQWVFYVVATTKIDAKLNNTKTITLKKLLTLNPQECSYKRLKRYIIEEYRENN